MHRIQQGFQRLGLQPEYAGVRVSDNLFWGRVWIDSFQIVCEGKGISRELAEASAYAELTERLSAGLYYPVFAEQVRFHLPGIYSPGTVRFLNYEWMQGYVRAYQTELDNTLTIEELLQRESHLKSADLAEIRDCEMASILSRFPATSPGMQCMQTATIFRSSTDYALPTYSGAEKKKECSPAGSR